MARLLAEKYKLPARPKREATLKEWSHYFFVSEFQRFRKASKLTYKEISQHLTSVGCKRGFQAVQKYSKLDFESWHQPSLEVVLAFYRFTVKEKFPIFDPMRALTGEQALQSELLNDVEAVLRKHALTIDDLVHS